MASVAVLIACVPAPSWARPKAPGSTSGAASPQTASTQSLPGVATLDSQSNWVVGAGTFSVGFSLPSSLAATSTVTASLYPKLSSRSAFQQSLDPNQAGSPLATTAPVPAASGSVTLAPLDPSSCPSSGCSGVYPVVLRFQNPAGAAPPPLVTEMIYLSTTGNLVPLGFSWVVTISPTDTPAGALRLADTLARGPQVPLDLLAVPQALAKIPAALRTSLATAMAELAPLTGAGGAGGSPAAVSSLQILADTYDSTDLAALAEAGLSGEIAQQFSRGRALTAAAFHVSPAPGILPVAGPVDRTSLSVLEDQGFGELLLPASDLSPDSSTLTSAHPWQLSGTGHSQPLVAVSDPELESDITSTADPVLAAHRVLADLAFVWSEAPNQTMPPRSLVLAPPPGTVVDPSFVATLLAGLSGNPIISPMTLSTYFAQLSPATIRSYNDTRSLAAGTRVPALPAAAIRSARTEVSAFSSALAPGSPRADAIGDLVLDAEADDQSASARAAELSGVTSLIDGYRHRITLAGADTITLTSRRGTLPVTVASNLSFPVQLTVSLTSEKLVFPLPTGSHCRPLARGIACPMHLNGNSSTIDLTVVSRASGDFPLRIAVTTPEGGMVFASATYTVRSTAFSIVAIALTSVAVAILVLWWGRTILSARRRPRSSRAPSHPVTASAKDEAPSPERVQ